MSISADKLSEIISAYQRISAYSLGGPAVLHGYMMAPALNGTMNAAGTFVMPTSVSNRSTSSSGALASVQNTTSASSSVNEQQIRAAAAAAAVMSRQSQASERRESISSTIDPEQDETEVEMMQFEGDAIPAFAVGGERRLYMPMLLRRLLQRGFDDGAIHAACEELKIHFQEATNEQMDALRRTLQADVPMCGLIKRSDAERLWALLDEASIAGDKLLDADMRPSAAPSQQSDLAACPSGGSSRTPSGSSSPTTATSERFGDLPSANSFRVYHACFGKQKGVFVPELYTAPDARCIVCVRCGAHCSPERFVTHVHRATAENNVAHWGFDPAKWRAYLLLSKDQHASKELRDYFESLKCKFDASRKRKVCSVALAQPAPASTPAPALGHQPRRAASPVDATCKKRKLDVAAVEQLACSASTIPTATCAPARPPQQT